MPKRIPKPNSTSVEDAEGLLRDLYDQCKVVLEIRDDIINSDWDACHRNPYNAFGESHANHLKRELENLKVVASRLQLGILTRRS